jgi:hypothetical protein
MLEFILLILFGYKSVGRKALSEILKWNVKKLG